MQINIKTDYVFSDFDLKMTVHIKYSIYFFLHQLSQYLQQIFYRKDNKNVIRKNKINYLTKKITIAIVK